MTAPDPFAPRARVRACDALLGSLFVLVLLIASGCVVRDGAGSRADSSDVADEPSSGSSADSPSVGPAVSSGEIGGLIQQLRGGEPSDGRGYDRSLFQPTGWGDVDGDGCDTRSEVLAAQSRTPVAYGSGCEAVAGDWLSIYDGYSTPDPSELDIDHVVALSEAWKSGADEWDQERRQAFADDQRNLLAVTAATNRSKNDRDPASWQPPNRSAWCAFARIWVEVKLRWDLSADDAERRALINIARGC